MNKRQIDRKKTITKLLDAVKDKTFAIEGDPDGLWFIIKAVALRRGCTKLNTDILVKFFSYDDFVILIPDKLELNSGWSTCGHFLQKCTFIQGWRALCPHMIANVEDDLLELVQRLAGLLGNPWFCGLLNCDRRHTPKAESFEHYLQANTAAE